MSPAALRSCRRRTVQPRGSSFPGETTPATEGKPQQVHATVADLKALRVAQLSRKTRGLNLGVPIPCPGCAAECDFGKRKSPVSTRRQGTEDYSIQIPSQISYVVQRLRPPPWGAFFQLGNFATHSVPPLLPIDENGACTAMRRLRVCSLVKKL